jgi:hypothetical protein
LLYYFILFYFIINMEFAGKQAPRQYLENKNIPQLVHRILYDIVLF